MIAHITTCSESRTLHDVGESPNSTTGTDLLAFDERIGMSVIVRHQLSPKSVSSPAEDHRNRAKKNLYVQQHIPVADVFEIEFDHALEGEAISSTDLPQPGK